MVKQHKPPEHLGSVPLNSGTGSGGKQFGGAILNGRFIPNATAQMIREVDPTGAIVAHPVRKSTYVHERLHNLSGPQKLADELYDAAEKFRTDFERAGMSGNYARMDLFKTRSGQQEISDKVAVAKMRISKALKELGNGKDEPSLSQSCVWNVVGLGITLDEWTNLVKASGKGMNADKSSGIFHASLERLALQYGMVDMGRLKSIGNDAAYARAVKDVFEFAGVFATAPEEKSLMGKFMAAASKRFGRFA